MKLLILVSSLLILHGCASSTGGHVVETVTKVERVVLVPPDELLVIPPQVMSIDVEHATQRDVAEWLIKSEQRALQLEHQIKAIIKWSKEVKR